MKTKTKILFMAAALICGLNQGRAALYTWSASPNTLIPDAPHDGLASGIYINPGSGNPTVASVSMVSFTITGGWAGDYTVMLKHTDGTVSQSVTLFSMLQGGNAANGGFNNVSLTSATGSPISGAGSSSTAAITGTYSGVDFSPFQNVSASGDWILYVIDGQPDDQGTLSSWSLQLDVVPEPANIALLIVGAWFGMGVVVRQARSRWGSWIKAGVAQSGPRDNAMEL